MNLKSKLFGVALALVIATPVQATDVVYPGPYQADVFRVYDGDTITANIHVWPTITIEASIRLDEIDTPEIRGMCDGEKEAAIKARDFVRNLVSNSNNKVWVRNVSLGKYAGRVVGKVFTETGENIGEAILTHGLGVPYTDRAAQRARLCPE